MIPDIIDDEPTEPTTPFDINNLETGVPEGSTKEPYMPKPVTKPKPGQYNYSDDSTDGYSGGTGYTDFSDFADVPGGSSELPMESIPPVHWTKSTPRDFTISQKIDENSAGYQQLLHMLEVNTKKAITKGGYSFFSRMNEAIRTLSVNQGAPLKSMRFIPENGEIALEVQASENSQIKVFSKADSMKLVTKLKDVVKAALLKTFLEIKPVKSKVVQVLQLHPQSNKFVNDGKNISISTQKFVHPARLSQLVCNGNNFSKELPKNCRWCGYECESQAHILQHCTYSLSSGITQRHDRVLNRILQEVIKGRKNNNFYDIIVDTEPGPTRERPDIIMIQRDGPEVLLADVTVPYENGVVAIEAAWDWKMKKYSHFIDYFARLGKRAVILPLVVGSLGSYWPDTSNSLRMLGLSDGQIRNLIPDISMIALESSKQIYWRHIFGDSYKIVTELYCRKDQQEVRFGDEPMDNVQVSDRFQPFKTRPEEKRSEEEKKRRSKSKKDKNWRGSKKQTGARQTGKDSQNQLFQGSDLGDRRKDDIIEKQQTEFYVSRASSLMDSIDNVRNEGNEGMTHIQF
ncbi:hypothetical protein CRE_02580 [Caenorhabditis remanei]|uniref:Uncharacterized protein n=1 Tax=Caenorhabditis remanei TaxID=31234 RepID=E3N4U4_CAERE|nr:hypothetical protein CRE_02580 [Caenorhabditis remanei]